MRRAASVRFAGLAVVLGATANAFAQTPSLQQDSARACAICHIGWMDAFAPGRAPAGSLLMDPPTTPLVARPETCLGCHDGSVGDSRRRVWLEHGHSVDIAPPAGMTVPPTLPLDNGKIECRTCHSAHGSSGGDTLATVIFLRLPAEQLCATCHSDHVMGTRPGTHPVTAQAAFPQALIDAGAHPPKDKTISCRVCHVAHGAQHDELLVLGTGKSELCLTCHVAQGPENHRRGAMSGHPPNPVLGNEVQRQAVADMGGRLGAENRLICLSCHNVHNAKTDRYLLPKPLQGGQFCTQCHTGYRRVLETPHNLLTSAPNEKNKLGQTVGQSGACSACHMFHQAARVPDPQPSDPRGLCSSCHKPDACAGSKLIGAISHPVGMTMASPRAGVLPLLHPEGGAAGESGVLDCVTCHDPHGGTQHGDFLRQGERDLCVTCHSGKRDTLVGAHDLAAAGSAVKNVRGQTAEQAGSCGVCHVVHNATGANLWGVAGLAPTDANGYCTACHSADGVAKRLPVAPHNHPMGEVTKGSLVLQGCPRPLYDANGRRAADGGIACASCHDPHGNSTQNPALLLGTGKAAELCTSCHRAQATAVGGVHDSTVHASTAADAVAAWPTASREQKDLCLACHQPHAQTAAGRFTAGMTDAPLGATCIGCHRDPGWAAWPAMRQSGGRRRGTVQAHGAIQGPSEMQPMPQVHAAPARRGCSARRP